VHTSFFFILISPCVSPTIQLVLISLVEAFIGVELLDLVLNQFGDLCQHVGSQLVLIAESAGDEPGRSVLTPCSILRPFGPRSTFSVISWPWSRNSLRLTGDAGVRSVSVSSDVSALSSKSAAYALRLIRSTKLLFARLTLVL